MSKLENYKVYFEDYIKSVFEIEVDIRFWKHFLDISIDRYKVENPINRWISQSGFSLYNIPPDSKNIWLHTSNATFTIEIDDLTGHSTNFFSWVMNMSIVRMYNAVEILLLRAIKLKHFPNLADPIKGKKETNKVIAEIKNHLKLIKEDVDTKNNRYLISFLRHSSTDIESFLVNSVNSANWKTSWNNFYELFSILRNIIAHQSMIIEKNVRNEINSIAGDIFNFYFDQPSPKVTDVLAIKDHNLFLNFTNHINDFSGNMVKFIAGENDPKFIGLYPA
jgi:hypothetical protein